MPGTAIHGVYYPTQLAPGAGPDVPAEIKQTADSIDPKLTPWTKGLIGARPAFGKQGQRYFATDEGIEYVDTGASWIAVSAPKKFRTSLTWAIAGEIKVASGDIDVVPPTLVSVAAGQTTKLLSAWYKVGNGAAGTRVHLKIQTGSFADTDIAGFGTTGAPLITAGSTNWALNDPADVAIADATVLGLTVVAIVGSPANLSVVLILEHTI